MKNFHLKILRHEIGITFKNHHRHILLEKGDPSIPLHIVNLTTENKYLYIHTHDHCLRQIMTAMRYFRAFNCVRGGKAINTFRIAFPF